MVELAELLHILPYSFIACMEDVSTVPMHINAGHFLGIAVATNMVSLFNNKTTLSSLLHLVGEDTSIKASTHNDIIVLFHSTLTVD